MMRQTTRQNKTGVWQTMGSRGIERECMGTYKRVCERLQNLILYDLWIWFTLTWDYFKIAVKGLGHRCCEGWNNDNQRKVR